MGLKVSLGRSTALNSAGQAGLSSSNWGETDSFPVRGIMHQVPNPDIRRNSRPEHKQHGTFSDGRSYQPFMASFVNNHSCRTYLFCCFSIYPLDQGSDKGGGVVQMVLVDTKRNA